MCPTPPFCLPHKTARFPAVCCPGLGIRLFRSCCITLTLAFKLSAQLGSWHSVRRGRHEGIIQSGARSSSQVERKRYTAVAIRVNCPACGHGKRHVVKARPRRSAVSSADTLTNQPVYGAGAQTHNSCASVARAGVYEPTSNQARPIGCVSKAFAKSPRGRGSSSIVFLGASGNAQQPSSLWQVGLAQSAVAAAPGVRTDAQNRLSRCDSSLLTCTWARQTPQRESASEALGHELGRRTAQAIRRHAIALFTKV